RQVTQTKIVIARSVLASGARTAAASLTVVSGIAVCGMVVSSNVTRPRLGASAPVRVLGGGCPLLPPTQAAECRVGQPARNATGAAAPRPPHARIDGGSPGSRVPARPRLPGFSQWLCGTGSPPTVAGAASALKTSLPTLPRPLPSLPRLRGREGRGRG